MRQQHPNRTLNPWPPSGGRDQQEASWNATGGGKANRRICGPMGNTTSSEGQLCLLTRTPRACPVLQDYCIYRSMSSRRGCSLTARASKTSCFQQHESYVVQTGQSTLSSPASQNSMPRCIKHLPRSPYDRTVVTINLCGDPPNSHVCDVAPQGSGLGISWRLPHRPPVSRVSPR